MRIAREEDDTHHKTESDVLGTRPLEGISIFAVALRFSVLVALQVSLLLDQDIRDQVVDDVGGEVGGVMSAPEDDAGRGEDLERIQHDCAPSLRSIKWMKRN